jgi:outer membrane protein
MKRMKNKNIILVILSLIIVVLVILFGINMMKNKKISYVNSVELVQKYKGMIEARKEMEKKSQVWQANIDTLVIEFQTELKKYEKERNSMSEKERRLNEELLNNKKVQVDQYSEAIRNKNKKENDKLAGEALTKLNVCIKEYGKKKGYLVILGANESGNVIYADETIDITKEVIEEANKQFSEIK